MRTDIERFCNGCNTTVDADVAKCPKCRTDANFSYFGGWYYDRFDLFSFKRQGDKAVDITLMQSNSKKQNIEPLLDQMDRAGSYQGFIVRKPGGGPIVYMTPLNTVTENQSTKSGCLVFIGAISLTGLVSILLGSI